MVYMFLKIFAIAFDIASAAYPQHSKQKLEMSNTQLAVLTVPHIIFLPPCEIPFLLFQGSKDILNGSSCKQSPHLSFKLLTESFEDFSKNIYRSSSDTFYISFSPPVFLSKSLTGSCELVPGLQLNI